MVNYLARLGWSHGDDEIFSRAQFLQWFDLDHLGKSAAQFDEAKLRWVNAQHIKALDNEALAQAVLPFVEARGLVADERLPALCGLYKDRCDTLVVLADWVGRHFGEIEVSESDRTQYLTDAVRPAIAALAHALQEVAWEAPAIGAVFKAVLAEHGLKMPQLAMPVRVLVMGTPQTPSVDAVLALQKRKIVIERLSKA